MEYKFLVLYSIGVQGKDSSTENYFAYWFCLEGPQGFLIMLPFSSQFVKNSYALQKWRDIGNYFVILIVHWMKNPTLQDGLLQSVKEALERKDQGIGILVSSLRVKSLAQGLHSKNKLKEANKGEEKRSRTKYGYSQILFQLHGLHVIIDNFESMVATLQRYG